MSSIYCTWNSKDVYLSIQKFNKMIPTKNGQIVKFHTPLEDENPNQLYVVVELFLDKEVPLASIQALGTGLSIPPIIKVKIEDLTVEEVTTDNLIGSEVTIISESNTEYKGRVVSARDKKILLDMEQKEDKVYTNVWLTISNNEKIEHSGYLLVNS